jgi:hypothetical protein
LGAGGSTEQIRDNRNFRSLRVSKEQCRTTRGDHSPVDLRNLQAGINRCIDNAEIAIRTQPIEKCPEVAKGLVFHLDTLAIPCNSNAFDSPKEDAAMRHSHQGDDLPIPSRHRYRAIHQHRRKPLPISEIVLSLRIH